MTKEQYNKIYRAAMEDALKDDKRLNISTFAVEKLITSINGYDPSQPTETIQETIPETKPEESTTNPFEGIEF